MLNIFRTFFTYFWTKLLLNLFRNPTIFQSRKLSQHSLTAQDLHVKNDHSFKSFKTCTENPNFQCFASYLCHTSIQLSLIEAQSLAVLSTLSSTVVWTFQQGNQTIRDVLTACSLPISITSSPCPYMELYALLALNGGVLVGVCVCVRVCV